MKLLPIVRKVSGSNCHPLSIKTRTVAHARVDDEDFDLLNQSRWIFGGNGRYPVKTVGNAQIPLQVEIARLAGWSPSTLVDHKDGNPLNAQKSNLRTTDYTGNNANSTLQRNSTSGFKGVSWDKRKGKYRAHITFQGKHIHIGYFNIPRKAAEEYDRAAIKFYKEFARTNKSLGLLP
jgi:hypothetical protein